MRSAERGGMMDWQMTREVIMDKAQAYKMIANLCEQLKLSFDEHKQVQAAFALLKPDDN